MNKSTQYTFGFGGGTVFVKIADRWRMIMKNDDTIHQIWKTLYAEKKPTNGKEYEMNINGSFKLRECQDADCPINGCKHASCYWADYDKKEILHEN
jgi:hypothetical protein